MNLPPLILASASPRRALLLQQVVPSFRIVPSAAAELHHEQLTARELAQINAVRKARTVAKCHPDALVLGADTLVSQGNRIFGKPRDPADARRMLTELQGVTHQVVTGICLLQLRRRRQRVFAEQTQVGFKPLSSEQIDQYLASIDPLDKAGAYAIQEGGEAIVARILGSYSNVVGLPVERLQVELAAWSVNTPE